MMKPIQYFYKSICFLLGMVLLGVWSNNLWAQDYIEGLAGEDYLSATMIDIAQPSLVPVNLETYQPNPISLLEHCEFWKPELPDRWFSFVTPMIPGDIYIYAQYSEGTTEPVAEFYEEVKGSSELRLLGCYALPNAESSDLEQLKSHAFRFSELLEGAKIWIRITDKSPVPGNGFYLGTDFKPHLPKSKSKSLLLPHEGELNYTCDKAICLVRDGKYSNRNRPYCYPCTGIWAPPNVTCSGANSWGLMDNPVFYKFEVLPSTPQPVSITLNVSSCAGGSGTLQLGIWSSAKCPGGGTDGFFKCSDGIGTLTVSTGLPLGQYFLVVDGGRGAECDWTFESNISLSANSNSPVCTGDEITLDVSQTAEGTRYLWKGPDGFTSTSRNPVIPNAGVQQSGTYSVMIFPPTGTLCPDTIEVSTTVAVNPKPEAEFMLSNSVLCAGQSTQATFVSNSSTGIIRWRFEGGIPATAVGRGPINVMWNQPGTYKVSVTVNTNLNCIGTSEQEVIVGPKPDATFNVSDQQICEGKSTVVTYEAIPFPGAEFAWNCSGCSQGTLNGPGPHTLSWLNAGQKQVSLTIKAADCESATFSRTIQVNTSPSAEFITPVSVCVNKPATVTYVGNGTPFNGNFAWECDGCSGFSPFPGGPHNLQWSSPGSKTLTLTTTEPRSSCQATKTQTIEVLAAPVASFTLSQQAVCTGQITVAQFTAISQNIQSYQWDCDGCFQQTLLSGRGPYNLTWNEAGNKIMQLTVTDSNNCTSPPFQQNLNVKPTPVARFNLPTNGCADQSIRLDFIGQANSNQANYAWICDGCSGLSSTTAGPHNISWSTGGIKTVSLEVTENGCISNKFSATIDITFVPITADNNGPVCSGESVVFEASGTPGATYIWQGPSGFSATGATVSRNPVSEIHQGNYSVTAIIGNCTSHLATTILEILPVPESVLAESPSFVCERSELQLSASDYLGALYFWTGPAEFKSNSQNPILTHVSPDNAGTYSLIAVLGNCTSSVKTTTVAIQHVETPTPVSQRVERCGNGNITFSFTTTEAVKVLLYDNLQNLIGEAPAIPFEIPVTLSVNTKDFVATAISAEGCESEGVPLTGFAHTIPAAPKTAGSFRCGTGAATFTVTMGNPAGIRVALYNSPSGGTLIAEDNEAPYELQTPILTATTTLYVEAIGNGGCRSISRFAASAKIGVIATISIPEIERCGAGKATFTMVSPEAIAIRLYTEPVENAAIGIAVTEPFTITTPLVSTTTTYFFAAITADGCQSNYSESKVKIIYPPAVSAPDYERCGAGAVTFTVSNVTTGTVNLYSDSTRTTRLVSTVAPPYQLFLGNVTETAQYYLEYSLGGGCISKLTPVTAIIKAPIPSNPQVESRNRCGAGSVALTVHVPAPTGDQIRFYDSNLSLISTFPSNQNQITTPLISTDATFYFESYDSLTGCTSARVPATVLVKADAEIPVANDVYRCGGGKAAIKSTLTIKPGTRLNLYNLPEGGTLLATDSIAPFEVSTPLIQGISTFYLSSYSYECNESDRVPVVVFTSALLDVPVITTPVTYGNDGSISVYPSGGYPPYSYALNTDENYGTNNIFSALPIGTYTIWVRDSRNCVANQEVIITAVPCAVTPEITASIVDGAYIEIAWVAVPHALKYEFQYRKAGDSQWSDVLELTTTSYQIKNLEPEATYEFRVRSVCAVKSSDFATIRFDTPICNSVNFLYMSEVTETAALVHWSDMEDAVGYEFSWREQGRETWEPLEFLTVSQRLLTNLKKGTSYEVKVRTLCFGGAVIADFVYNGFTTLQCEPAQNLKVANISQNTAQITWNPAPYVDGYEVGYRKQEDLDWTTLTTPTNAITLANLESGKIYLVRVRPLCKGDRNDYRQLSFTTKTDANNCPIPTLLQISSQNGSSAILNWETHPAVGTYMLRFRPAGGNWVYVSIPMPYKLENLNTGVVYEAQLRAICSTSFSDWVAFPPIFLAATKNTHIESKDGIWQLYPNPTTGKFTLDRSQSYQDRLQVAISTLDGILLETHTIQPEAGRLLQFDLSSFAAGIYMVSIKEINGNTHNFKIILLP